MLYIEFSVALHSLNSALKRETRIHNNQANAKFLYKLGPKVDTKYITSHPINISFIAPIL